MNLFRSFLVLAIASALLAVPSSAWAAKKKKKGGGAAAGVIENVTDGNLMVKVMGKKKKGAAGETKTFKLTKETKIEKMVGKKKNKTAEPATAADLKVGDRVVVSGAGGKAETVKILGAKKKKKKKNV